MSHAVSTRLSPAGRATHGGQRGHDMRFGDVPAYVDTSRSMHNSIAIAPPTPEEMAGIALERRQARYERGEMRRYPRSIRSDATVAVEGIITFGADAQPIIDRLPWDEQERRYREAAEAIAEEVGTDVAGLVIHRDESAPHAHIVLSGYAPDGTSVAQKLKKGTLSKAQDAAATAYADIGVGRGKRIGARIADGESPSAYIHRSVTELHRDLPGEIEAARALAEAEQEGADAAARRRDAAQTEADEAEIARDRLETQIAEMKETARVEWEKFETAEQRRITAQTKADEAEGQRKDLERRIATYERRAGDAEQRAKDAEGEVTRLQDELKALANSDEDQPKQRQVTVPQTEERGWGPWSRRAVVGERRLTYIKPSDTEKWRGAVLKRAKDARKEADQRGKEAAAAERQRKQEAEQRQRLQNALIQTMTAPAPCRDANAALWAAEAVLVERYGVQMQVAENIARVPLQEGLSDRQIAAALYREGREQGWERQWFSVSVGIAREIIALARQDLRLDEISFRDDGSGEAASLLQEAIDARDADPMVEPPQPSHRLRPRDEFGF